MTRVLVYGGSDIEDPAFVHNALTEVNRTYGPISCVIHANHAQALAWQQWAARKQVTRHMPIVADFRDGKVMTNTLHRDRMFTQGRPDYLVAFETKSDRKELAVNAYADEPLKATNRMIYRAQSRGITTLVFTFDPHERAAQKTLNLTTVPPSMETPLPEAVNS